MSSSNPSRDQSNIQFPLLTQSGAEGEASKPISVTASSLLATHKAAKSSTNPYKTLSLPIDRIIGPFLRPGYGLQISGPPGTYVEQLLIGLIKSVTSDGKEVLVVDMQNKLKAEDISEALNDDQRVDRVHYQMIYTPDEVVDLLTSLPKFLSTHSQLSLLILSCLSFPLQLETNFSKKNAFLDRIRELVIKLCKRYNLVTVVTSTMSNHFINGDGTRGTFDNDSMAIMVPQIDLSCKSISSLIISRDDLKSGRAVLIPATDQAKLRVEFDYIGLEFRDKAP